MRGKTMKKTMFARCAPLPALAAAAFLMGAPAAAQQQVPIYKDRNGNFQGAQGVIILNADGSSQDGANASQVQGSAAQGSAPSGNPLPIGIVNVDNGNTMVRAMGNQNGAIFTQQFFPNIGRAGATNNVGDTESNGMVLPYGVEYQMVYNGSSWTRSRGDTTGAYAVNVPSPSVNAGTNISSTVGASAALVAKGSAGNLYGYNVVSGASAGYVLVLNSATVPADGAVTPARCIPLAANTGIDVNLRGQPVYFSAGVTVAFSTTGCFTKTSSATAFIAVDVK